MIYLDNSATSSVYPEVLDAMLPYLSEEFGNPSSKYYTLAVNARKAVEESRVQVARLINASPEEIIFTCGSTESSNMIIKGVADYRKYYDHKGNHIITSKAEHHATLNTCKYLNGDIYSNQDASFSLMGTNRRVDRGYNVSFLDVNEYGQVSPDVFEHAIQQDTILASFIWANNEIGSLNDMPALVDVAHKHMVPIHADGTQIVGKMPVDVKTVPVDYLSISAHKFHGPKGVGAAYYRADDYGIPPVSAFMHGGEQENGLRAGTLAVHNIVGMGKAAEITYSRQQDITLKLTALEEQAKEAVAVHSRLHILGDPVSHIPGVISLVVDKPDFDNERFIHHISADIAISTGSACTAGKPSHVLQSIHRGNETSKVIRVSFSPDNTIDQFVTLINSIE